MESQLKKKKREKNWKQNSNINNNNKWIQSLPLICHVNTINSFHYMHLWVATG